MATYDTLFAKNACNNFPVDRTRSDLLTHVSSPERHHLLTLSGSIMVRPGFATPKRADCFRCRGPDLRYATSVGL
jgi:hypothetical protein